MQGAVMRRSISSAVAPTSAILRLDFQSSISAMRSVRLISSKCASSFRFLGADGFQMIGVQRRPLLLHQRKIRSATAGSEAEKRTAYQVTDIDSAEATADSTLSREAKNTARGRGKAAESRPRFSQMHHQIMRLAKLLTPEPAELQQRNAALVAIFTTIRTAMPSAQVYVFGSTSTGLLLPCSDMDVLVVEPRLNQNAMFKKLMKVLRKSRLLEHNRCLHIKAKVPILKFRLSQSQVDVDLSVNIYDGVRNSQAIRKNLMLFPQLRPLIITLKCFLAQQHMNATASGGVGSYLLYAMCLQLMPGTTLGITHSEAHGASDLDGPVLNGHGFNQLEAERDGFGGVTPPNLSRLTVPPSSHTDGVDLGKLLLQFLRVYGARKKSLCILDPMKASAFSAARRFYGSALRLIYEHSVHICFVKCVRRSVLAKCLTGQEHTQKA